MVILKLAMESPGRDDIALDLTQGDLSAHPPITLKEGTEYRLKLTFRVQNDVVSGLKYLQVVKRKGIRVDKTEEMVGSYGPRAEPYEKKFGWESVPSGMIARGKYNVRSRFIDDDKNCHKDFEWSFEIKKEWE